MTQTYITADLWATFTAEQQEQINRQSMILGRQVYMEDIAEILDFGDRLEAVEADNSSDDGRLDDVEAEDVTQEGRLVALEAFETAADGRLDALEAEDTALDGRLDTLESFETAADGRLDALEAFDTATDGRLDTLEANPQTVYAGTHATVGGDASETIAAVGVLPTDIVTVTVKTLGVAPAAVMAAAAGTDQIDVTMSIDPSTDHVLQYTVTR